MAAKKTEPVEPEAPVQTYPDPEVVEASRVEAAKIMEEARAEALRQAEEQG